MKKKLARLLFKWARLLDPSVVYYNLPQVRQMGITLHIAKKDVREWRKSHPECKSHRQGLKSLIEDARWQVAGAIGRGLIQKEEILFDINSTPFVADVSGRIFLYAKEAVTTEGKQDA